MRHLLPAIAAVTALLPAQNTGNWPQFLGAEGTAKGAGATTLNFDLEQDLRYRVEIPAGASSPCVWGDRIFMTGRDADRLTMFALDRDTGASLWSFDVPAPGDTDFQHIDAGLAMPTACTNGERVFFYIPSYGLVARKLDGELVWEKRLPDPKPAFGMGSSPIIFEQTVILLRDGCPDSALYALDEKTGEEAWTVQRAAFFDSHTTPFVWKNKERTELVIASSGSVISFDPQTGTEHWRVEGLTPLVCTTPTATEDRLYFAGWSTPAASSVDRMLDGMHDPITVSAEERADPALLFQRFDSNHDSKISFDEMPEGRMRDCYTFLDRDADGGVELAEWIPLFERPVMGKNVMVAIKPGGKGNVTDTHVEWTVKRGIPYVASPLLYDGRIYLVKAGGILSCFDATTGKPRFARTRLDDHSEYYATPLGVDGHVLICSSAGTLYVLEAADALKIVHTVEFDERIFATPAIADGTVYIRTREALYAFGSAD